MNNQPFWALPYEGMSSLVVSAEEWTSKDFIAEIRAWPRLPIVLTQPGEQEYSFKLRNFYQRHALWLKYSLLEMNPAEREELRVNLHFNHYAAGKPYADFSLAIRELCRQIYGKSPLLTQPPSFDHLWFLVEYSNYLQMMNHSGLLTGLPYSETGRTALSTDDAITSNHDSIRIYEQALVNNCLETQELSLGQDWRENCLNVLIAETILTAIKNKDRNLKRHCKQFLCSFHDYNAASERENFIIWYLVNGKLTKSTPGGKPIKLPVSEFRRPRGRPIGRQNRKKGL